MIFLYLARTLVTPLLSLMPNSRLRSCKARRQVNTDKHNMSDSVALGTIANMQNGYETNVARLSRWLDFPPRRGKDIVWH